MGYACPVCGTPQADARHLANHLAFTAMLHGEDHEAWLDEHAPDWEAAGERDLADRAAELADDADYPQVFEDTTGRTDAGHDHAHDHDDPPAERSGALFDEGTGGPPEVDPAVARDRATEGLDAETRDLDAETREIVAEAQELTREMLADSEAESDEPDTDDPRSEGSGAGESGSS